jgi:addiction module HigA family antidote
MAKKLAPIPPGEVLFEEFMKPLGMSRNRLAGDIDIPVSRVSDIVRGKRSITADSALRLAEYFGTSPELWLNLQAGFDRRAVRS